MAGVGIIEHLLHLDFTGKLLPKLFIENNYSVNLLHKYGKKDVKKEVIFALLEKYAGWEAVFVAPASDSGVEWGRLTEYITRMMSVTKEPVHPDIQFLWR